MDIGSMYWIILYAKSIDYIKQSKAQRKVSLLTSKWTKTEIRKLKSMRHCKYNVLWNAKICNKIRSFYKQFSLPFVFLFRFISYRGYIKWGKSYYVSLLCSGKAKATIPFCPVSWRNHIFVFCALIIITLRQDKILFLNISIKNYRC